MVLQSLHTSTVKCYTKTTEKIIIYLARRNALMFLSSIDVISGGVFIYYFLRYGDVTAIAKVMPGLWSFLFLCAVRICIGILGLAAACTRNVTWTKCFFGGQFMTVFVILLLLQPFWVNECRCDDYLGCEALNAYAIKNGPYDGKWLNPWPKPGDKGKTDVTRRRRKPKQTVFEELSAPSVDAAPVEIVDTLSASPKTPRGNFSDEIILKDKDEDDYNDVDDHGTLNVFVDTCVADKTYEKSFNVFDYFNVSRPGIAWYELRRRKKLKCKTHDVWISNKEYEDMRQEALRLENGDIDEIQPLETSPKNLNHMRKEMIAKMWDCVYTYLCLVIKFIFKKPKDVTSRELSEHKIISCMLKGPAGPWKEPNEGSNLQAKELTVWMQKNPYIASLARDQKTKERCRSHMFAGKFWLITGALLNLFVVWLVFYFIQARCADRFFTESQFEVDDADFSSSEEEEQAPSSPGGRRKSRRSSRNSSGSTGSRRASRAKSSSGSTPQEPS